MPNQTCTTKGISNAKSGFIEILLGYAIIVSINLFWFRDNPGFQGLKYHPFWIVILLISVRYGFREGLAAGAGGAIIMLFLVKISNPELAISDLAGYEYLETPLIFIIAGVFLGELRQSQIRRFTKLNSDHEKLQTTQSNLLENFGALNEAKKELDTRIIGQEQTVSTLYEAAQDLKSLKEADIYPATLDILSKFTGAQQCSVYMLLNDKLKLAGNFGWPDNANRPDEAGLDMGMMGKAFTTGNTVSVNYMLKMENLNKFADLDMVISAPVTDNKEQVLGVLNIEKLPFIKFNPQTIRMTSLIADWCGSAIENARTFKDTKDKNISDDVTGAYTFNYLNERVSEEFQRARRYKLALGSLFIEIDEFDLITDDMRQDVLSVLGFVLKNNTRHTDFLFNYSAPGQFILLLPHTDLKGIEILETKIMNEINAFKFKPYQNEERLLEIKTGMSLFSEEMEAPDELINMAINGVGVEKIE